jgi:hypothetical protein
MSGHDRDRSSLPKVERGARSVAVRVGNQVYTPALPVNPSDALEVAKVLGAHGVAVAAMDNFHAAAAAFQAHRSVIWNEAADVEAQRDAQDEMQHQRALARKRRDRELLESDLAIMETEHKIEAAQVFKERKFEAGFARYAKKTADWRVGEATARAAMQDEILEPEPNQPGQSKYASATGMLARLIEDIERQIDDAEAAGRPTDGLRSEVRSLNAVLRRELLKSAGT